MDSSRVTSCSADDKNAAGRGCSQQELRITIILLRSLQLVLAIVAVALMVTDRETGAVPIPFFGLPRPIFITRTAKYELIKGLKFYVDSLGVVVGYTVLQLLFNIGLAVTRGTVVDGRNIAWMTFVADSMMAYLAISAAAVATEIGYIAEQGAPAVLWRKVCSSFGYFCTVYAISVVFCFLTALVSFVVVAVSAYHLFRLYGIQQRAELETRAEKLLKNSVTE